MRVQFTLWRSRVARTVFLLFLGSAFVPLIVQAVLAGRWVEHQLIDLAEERLDRVSRAAQMTIIEDLQHLDRTLAHFAATVSAQRSLPQSLDEVDGEGFSGFALSGGADQELATIGDFDSPPDLSGDELLFLQSGRTLLTLFDGPDGRPRLLMVRLLEGADGEPRTLMARLRPESLWENEQLVTTDAEVLLTDSSGRPLYTTLPEGSATAALERALAEGAHGVRVRWKLAGREYLGSCRTVFVAPQFHANLRVLYGQAEEDILAPVGQFRRTFLLVLALTFWVVLIVSLRQIQRVLRPIEELGAGVTRIASHDFSQPVVIETRDEFQNLAESFNSMSNKLDRHLRIESEMHAIGMALNGENDSERVIELVLHSAQALVNADNGCFVLAESDGTLKLARVHLDAKGTLPELVDSNEGRMQAFSLDPPRSVVAHAVAREDTLQLADWRAESDCDLSEELAFEQAYGSRTRAVMAIALRDHEGEVIGVLQVGRHPDGAHIGAFSDKERRLLEALAAQSGTALAKNNLIASFRRMMMSMTEVFAMAVDEKSPYTGAHCKRVPELTMMLAESARSSKSGPLADFNPTDEEMFELRVAALLHDCGKVVTPVHVMDKATKLETIHDRIGLVDFRFEVIKRDARIALLEEQLRSGTESNADERTERDLALRLARIEEDCEFLRQSNVGSEWMKPEDRVRVHSIAASYNLLGPNGESVPVLTDEEVENLTVRYGTLTAAERKIVNDHIVVTIRMLEALDYPRELSRVPILAGTHHERMDGKGYPRGLTREEIPVGGRIMGIADVFEALTDDDRPYKGCKSLQESLEILGEMTLAGHLDADLFQLFMDEEIYLRFARGHLSPERIGPLDLARIPGYIPPAERGACPDSSARHSA